jgi:hypothetical protein
MLLCIHGITANERVIFSITLYLPVVCQLFSHIIFQNSLSAEYADTTFTPGKTDAGVECKHKN